ncbi:hypothetical protein OH77DRAFT_1415874, partial [Trametes cingulata]
EVLGLPSDFSAEEQSRHGFVVLAEYELKIRIGLAFDQLDAVRMAVQYRAAQLENKKKNLRSNKANAVAERHLQQAALRARVLAARYNANYTRISALRATDYVARNDDTPGGRLRTIDVEKDLTIANMAAARTLGDSRVTGSWIWSWFRAKAAKHRADEAVNKICAEFRRTSMGYSAYADLWRQAAHKEGKSPGERAYYALKTAAMWDRMRTQCDDHYDASRRAGVDAAQLDQSRVCTVVQATGCGS